MVKVNLSGENWVDIYVNEDLVLHVNRNTEGYSVDMYETIKGSYDKSNYDCDNGFLGGTYCFFSEMEQYQDDED